MDSQLAAVVIGGLIATISGGLIPWIQHRLAAEEKRNQLRRDCILQLVDAIYSYQIHLDHLQNKIVFGSNEELSPNTMPIIRGLVAVDFPEHYDAFQEFDLAAAAVVSYFYEKGKERVGSQEINLEGFGGFYKPYVAAKENLLSLVTGRQTSLPR